MRFSLTLGDLAASCHSVWVQAHTRQCASTLQHPTRSTPACAYPTLARSPARQPSTRTRRAPSHKRPTTFTPWASPGTSLRMTGRAST